MFRDLTSLEYGNLSLEETDTLLTTCRIMLTHESVPEVNAGLVYGCVPALKAFCRYVTSESLPNRAWQTFGRENWVQSQFFHQARMWRD